MSYLGYREFETNQYGDDSTATFGGATYKAQTFTPGRSHDLELIRVKLIRTGACGVVTLGLYATDDDGKPTGSALASGTVAQATVPGAAGWVDFTLSYRVSNDKYAIVLSAAAAGVGARSQSTGTYTAGSAFTSTDSGSSWTETATADVLFREYGEALPLYGVSKIQLIPNADGTYTQLVPSLGSTIYNNASSDWNEPAHFLCVADPVDSPDEITSTIAYSLHEWVYPQSVFDEFLSGNDDSAAGTLTGTSLLFRCGNRGITGIGTSFTTELAENYLIRSPSINYFWKDKGKPRISKISSVTNDTVATLTKAPHHGVTESSPETTFKNAWYITPNSEDNADKMSVKGVPFKNLSGEWTVTNGSSTITATGGDAVNETSLEYDAIALCGPVIYGYSGGNLPESVVGGHWAVGSVVSDDEMTMVSKATASDVHPSGSNYFAVLAQKDALDDSDTATQWCLPTKKDSFLVKSTLNKGTVKDVEVVYRVAVRGSSVDMSPTLREFNTEDWPSSTTRKTVDGTNIVAFTFTTTDAYDLQTCTVRILGVNWWNPQIANLYAVDGNHKPTGAVLATGVTHGLFSAEFHFSSPPRLTAATEYAIVLTCDTTTPNPLGLDNYYYVYYDSSSSYSGYMWNSANGGTSWTEQTDGAVMFILMGTDVPTGSAKPFLYLNSTTVSGTEVTVTATGDETQPVLFKTYREALARPGGGQFDLDDFRDLEVGINLGDVSNPNIFAVVMCTQIYLDVTFSLEPAFSETTVGMTEHGFKTFENGMDEHGRPVFDNGMALFFLQKVYRNTVLNPYHVLPRMTPAIKKVKTLLSRKKARSVTTSRKARSQ